jgi:hypothetical protein
MGAIRFFSGHTEDPNPDPSNFEIIGIWEDNGFTLLHVNYPGCTTYEGRKLLLYDKPHEYLVQQKILDFSKDHLCPIARFEPTSKGQMMARVLMAALV